MYKYILFILSVVTISCTKTVENDYTYFGGKIINPKSDYILLRKEGKTIDSIPLSKNNTFMSKLC